MNRRRGWRVGEGHHNAKLSDATVAWMRKKYLPYVRGYGWLAMRVGCGVSTARDIVTYRTRP